MAARVVSRFGDISPAFADAYGASVDIGLSFESRRGVARELSAASRYTRVAARVTPLPAYIPTVQDLPPSRVSAGMNAAPKR